VILRVGAAVDRRSEATLADNGDLQAMSLALLNFGGG